MYFALKSVKFDKNYNRGEEIPEETIASNMAEKLIRCGVIQKINEPDELPKEKIKAVKQPKKV